jgi:flagellar hook-associated protein 1 FlgK
LNDFFDSMQKIAADPTEPAARSEFITRAQNLVSSVTASYTRVVEAQNNIAIEASSTTDQVNSLSSQIAVLNENISRVEIATSAKANDLRDQRQKLIESLSSVVGIRTSLNPSNASMVDIELTDLNNGALPTPQFLVVGTEGGGVGASVALSTDTAGGNAPLRIIATGTGSYTITSTLGGQLGAEVEVSRNQIGTIGTSGTILGNLNAFASALITQVNTMHTAGFDLSNNAGLAIFTGANITNMAFNTAITGPGMIAASDTSGQILNGGNANDLAQLRELSIAGLGNRSLLEYHRSEVVIKAGFNAQQAKTNSDAQSIIYASAVQQQNSLSGISIDEEMVNLTSFQRAFEASARFMETLDEMINRIVNGI